MFGEALSGAQEEKNRWVVVSNDLKSSKPSMAAPETVNIVRNHYEKLTTNIKSHIDLL